GTCRPEARRALPPSRLCSKVTLVTCEHARLVAVVMPCNQRRLPPMSADGYAYEKAARCGDTARVRPAERRCRRGSSQFLLALCRGITVARLQPCRNGNYANLRTPLASLAACSTRCCARKYSLAARSKAASGCMPAAFILSMRRRSSLASG